MGWFTKKRGERFAHEEYDTLSGEDRRRVDAVVKEVKRTGKPASHAHGADEYYGYPHASDGVSWGINAPLNTKRGAKCWSCFSWRPSACCSALAGSPRSARRNVALSRTAA